MRIAHGLLTVCYVPFRVPNVPFEVPNVPFRVLGMFAHTLLTVIWVTNLMIHNNQQDPNIRPLKFDIYIAFRQLDLLGSSRRGPHFLRSQDF